MQPIDVILTSYARWDLLDITLSSFFQHNTYPINKFVIHEDKGLKNFTDEDWKQLLRIQTKFPKIIWITPDERQGQIKALDKLHSCITTDYYLSLEDDWECQKDGFIQDGLELMQWQTSCICVWLRGISEEAVNNHPLLEGELHNGAKGINYMQLSTNYNWKGFSFAPTIKFKPDYISIGSYEKQTKPFIPERPWEGEYTLGQLYFKKGFYALTLKETYFTHIGGNGRGIRS